MTHWEMNILKKVELYTDGACSGNPGKGGFGIVLKYNETEKSFSKGYKFTTNNRMELSAVVTGLSMLKYPCEVTVYSDSKYVVDAIEKGWLFGWMRKGWKKADGKPAINSDLWKQLVPLLKIHDVSFVWLKGHDGHKYNELCDKLATEAYNADEDMLETDVGMPV